MFRTTADDDVYDFDIENFDAKPQSNTFKVTSLKSQTFTKVKTGISTSFSSGSEDALEKAKRMLSKYSDSNPNKVVARSQSKSYSDDELSFDDEDSNLPSSSKDSNEQFLAEREDVGASKTLSKSVDYFDEDFTDDYTSHLTENISRAPPARIQRESGDSDEFNDAIDPTSSRDIQSTQYNFNNTHSLEAANERPKVMSFEGIRILS